MRILIFITFLANTFQLIVDEINRERNELRHHNEMRIKKALFEQKLIELRPTAEEYAFADMNKPVTIEYLARPKQMLVLMEH